MRLSDRRLRRLTRELGELVEPRRLREMDLAELRDRLAELAEAIERRGRTRRDQERERERAAHAPWVLALGGLGLAAAAALWLRWDASRWQQLQRQLSDLRETGTYEAREAMQRGRLAAERALSQLPADPEEARRLVQQTAEALEEATSRLRDTWSQPPAR